MATRLDLLDKTNEGGSDNAVHRGDDLNIDLVATDDGTSSGTPENITGWTFEMTIRAQRDEADSTDVLLTVAGSITDAANGAYRYSLTGTQALALDATGPRYYWWDSRRVNEGAERVLTEGYMEVKNTAGGRAS